MQRDLAHRRRTEPLAFAAPCRSLPTCHLLIPEHRLPTWHTIDGTRTTYAGITPLSWAPNPFDGGTYELMIAYPRGRSLLATKAKPSDSISAAVSRYSLMRIR